eukprot:NODE_45_length_27728_cov_0.328387.p18 type:complete len:162 gc:universal NODE_45_length_27728_cov_0.328387:16210-16695(+)
MKEIPYHSNFSRIPLLLCLYSICGPIYKMFIILEFLSIYIKLIPFTHIFINIHYFFFVLIFPFVSDLDLFSVILLSILTYFKRNWIAVFKLYWGYYYPSSLVCLVSVLFSCSPFIPVLTFIFVQSITSFQVVQVVWKTPFQTGALIWISSNEERTVGSITV